MGDSVFRAITVESTPVAPTVAEIKPEIKGEVVDTSFNAEADNLVLESLGISDELKNLPEESKENLSLIEDFVSELMRSKQLKETGEAFRDTFKGLMEDMDIDPHTEPSAVLDRIGGVIRGWKNLSFISDPKEKRSLFMKLGRMQSSKEMNRFIFQEMNRREVYA